MNIPKPSGKVHSFAARFPLCPEEEIQELANDIKLNGLKFPVVLDIKGDLVDGRNRVLACKIAGVNPTYAVLDGQDPIGFILSVNSIRRHMSKGQRAMMAAIARGLLNNSTTVRTTAKQAGTDLADVGRAAVVLQYRGDLEDSVISGAMSLMEAYRLAQERKEASESDQAWMIKLRIKAPDLADQIAEERLSLAESKAAFHAREKEEAEKAAAKRQERKLRTEQLVTALRYLDPWGASSDQCAAKILNLFDPSAATSEVTAAQIKQCSAVLTRLAEIWPQK